MADRIRSGVQGQAEGEIAAALIAGVRAGIPEEANEALRKTGLAHILSISGLHMALVAATVMATLRVAFAAFPGFSSRRPVKKYAAVIALAVLSVYLFISGSEVAADRSFVMIAVMLLAVLFDRQALTMRNFAIAATLLVLAAPHEVVGPSFQMSFSATAALIGGYGAWTQRDRMKRRRAPGSTSIPVQAATVAGRYLLGLFMTSLIAGTATAAYGAYHFQRVSVVSLVANLAAMPIVSALVMPFALIGVLLMPLGLDGWAFAVMGQGLSALLVVADWFAELSPVDAVGMIPPLSLALLTLALIMATLPTTGLRFVAIPFLVAGLAVLATRSMPDVLVSEDGRLVAMRGGDQLAVNRTRPNAFILEDWQRALDAERVVKPARPGEALGQGSRFVCSPESCVADAGQGRLVVHAEDAHAASLWCGTAALVILASVSEREICPHGATAVVTKRDLARRGSAAVTFRRGREGWGGEIVFAFAEPYRPWHMHRAYSRAARGLPERGWGPSNNGDGPRTLRDLSQGIALSAERYGVQEEGES